MGNLISNFIGFNGRLNRQTFWLSAIILAVVGLVISLVILPLLGLGIMPTMPPVGTDMSPADISGVLGAARTRAGWVNLVLFVVFLYPSAAFSIKRRHDRNNSGIDVWIYFALLLILQVISALGIGMMIVTDAADVAIPIPNVLFGLVGLIAGIYGIYMFVVLGFLKGTAGANKYGPDPLQG